MDNLAKHVPKTKETLTGLFSFPLLFPSSLSILLPNNLARNKNGCLFEFPTRANNTGFSVAFNI